MNALRVAARSQMCTGAFGSLRLICGIWRVYEEIVDVLGVPNSGFVGFRVARV